MKIKVAYWKYKNYQWSFNSDTKIVDTQRLSNCTLLLEGVNHKWNCSHSSYWSVKHNYHHEPPKLHTLMTYILIHPYTQLDGSLQKSLVIRLDSAPQRQYCIDWVFSQWSSMSPMIQPGNSADCEVTFMV